MPKPKWAVEHTHTVTGETIRYMETHQEWVAELMRDSANVAFEKDDRPMRSAVVRIQ